MPGKHRADDPDREHEREVNREGDVTRMSGELFPPPDRARPYLDTAE